MATQEVGSDEQGGLQGSGEDALMTGVPTLFANGFAVVGQVYGIQLIFTLRNGPSESAQAVANIHVSPQLAKVIGRLIRRNILSFEQKIGPIVLPDEVLEQLNIRELEE